MGLSRRTRNPDIRAGQEWTEIFRLRFISRIATAIAVLCWCSALGVASNDTTGLISPTAVCHPDGRLGQFSLNGQFSYASVSADNGTALKDIQQYVAGIGLVPHDHLSLSTSFEARQQDSTIYELWSDLKIYLKNPLTAVAANADGPTGIPVLHLTGGARYSASPDAATRGLAKAAMIFPVSTILTLTGGYHFYEAIEASDITRTFGSVTLYTNRYPAGKQYLNPDGPPGFLAIKLSGGGSSRGYFGKAEFILPLQQVTTLKLLLGAEQNDLLSHKSLQVGIGVAVYPLPR